MAWQFSGYDPVEPFKGPWRVGHSIRNLAEAVDEAWPSRAKTSDGTKGNEAHQQRNSDHNPQIDLNGTGIVTAIDITHDPSSGADMGLLAERVVRQRHPAVKYIIYNRRIIASYSRPWRGAWKWGRYYGSNPHTTHLHCSVLASNYDNSTPWSIKEDDDMQFWLTLLQAQPDQFWQYLFTNDQTGELQGSWNYWAPGGGSYADNAWNESKVHLFAKHAILQGVSLPQFWTVPHTHPLPEHSHSLPEHSHSHTHAATTSVDPS